MPEFDVDALRARFPALAIEQDGRPVALFDGPGGTQVPDIGHRGRQPATTASRTRTTTGRS